MTREAPLMAQELVQTSGEEIHRLVRGGAIVKKFAVRETETVGLLVRLKAEHLEQNGQVRRDVLEHLSAVIDVAVEFRGLPLSDVGLRSFLQVVKPIGLDLSGTDVTNRGLEELAQADSLRLLDLSFTRVDAAGLKPLAKRRELRSLSLLGCPVGDDAVEVLSKISGLREIYVAHTRLSMSAVEQLRASLPGCRIQR